MSDEIAVCPVHGTSKVEKLGNGDRGPDAGGAWYCEEGHHFDEPEYREPIGSRAPSTGVAADIARRGGSP